MLRKFWQWLKQLWQQWFGGNVQSPSPIPREELPPTPQLSDTDYEVLFLQLLDDPNPSAGQVKGWLLSKNLKEQNVVAWLKRFGDRLHTNPDQHQALAEKLMDFGQRVRGAIGQAAQSIAAPLLPEPPESEVIEAVFTGDPLAPASSPVERQDNTVEALLEQAQKAFQANDFNMALALADQVTEVEPNQPQGWLLRGEALRLFQRSEEALASLERALDLDGTLLQGWITKGTVLITLNRPEEALGCYDRALAIRGDLSNIWYNRAVTLYFLGRHGESIADYDRALELNPEFPLAWGNRGSVLYLLGRHEEAVVSYDRTLALDPQNYSIWANRGAALCALGRYEEAIASCDRALELNPGNEVAEQTRNEARAALGDTQ